MPVKMSVERKLLPVYKPASRGAKNSESQLVQVGKSERAVSNHNNNGRRSCRDGGFFKDRGPIRDLSVTTSDGRSLACHRNNRNSNKSSYLNGKGLTRRSEVTEGRTPVDVGSVFRPGSKKGGEVLGDLLNFNFGPADLRTQRRSGFSRIQSYEDYGSVQSYHKTHGHGPWYNKEQFLLANCQFVVKDNLDYAAYLTDPDLLVDWERIEEVRLLQPEPPSCPICLYPPVAAKITRCGHVFCWPCILHYLSLSDKQWRKCPICYESIYRDQLRSCRAAPAAETPSPVAPLSEKTRVTLRLMRRERGSNVALPANAWTRERNVRLARLDDEYGQFTKMLTINARQTQVAVVNREKDELNRSLEHDKGAPECCFILQALDLLAAREAVLLNGHNKEAKIEAPIMNDVKQQSDVSDSPRAFEDAFNSVTLDPMVGEMESSCRGIEALLDPSFDPSVRIECSKAGIAKIDCVPKKLYRENSADKSYYFYQADNGQSIFMHPLNVHCLIREYGSLERAPDTVAGLVVQIETYTMNADIRKHYRYLGHLPSTCVFSLIEIEFDPDQQIVSNETLLHFADDFVKRRIARERKAKDEQRQQKKCQRWEKAMLLNSAGGKPLSLNDADLDDIPISTFVQSAQGEIEAGLSSSSADRKTRQSDVDTRLETNRNNVSSRCGVKSNESSPLLVDAMEKTLSFAQMLKCGKPKPAARQTPRNLAEVDQPTSSCTLENEYAPSALSNYRSEVGDALQAAFDSLKSQEEKSSTNGQNESTRASKKKNKGKILFTL